VSVRHLDHLFRPRSIAIVGASERPGSLGSVLTRNVIAAGFEGDVLPVNPKYEQVAGRECHPDVAALPVTPELAVICVPAPVVPGVISELGEKGTRAAVVISAGFAEGGAEGRALQREVLETASRHDMRVVGPNCVGVAVPGVGLNATFAHLQPAEGRVAFVTQSGAVVTAVLDWAHPRGIGFSHLVSLGAMADVDFGDMLDYLASDPATDAILLYMEAAKEPRKFMSAARAAARSKPVIAVKAGRHEESARAAASHTGRLAGSDAVYDAALRRAGILRVLSLEELFDAVETLAVAHGPTVSPERPQRNRLTIVTNGGGLGVLAADELVELGGELAELSEETLARLDALLPPTWSRANPVDIVGDATAERFGAVLDVLTADPSVDGIVVINCPTALMARTDAAEAVARAGQSYRRGPFLTCWVGAETAEEPRHILARNGIATYESPEDAVRAFMHLVEYGRRQRVLIETPPSLPEGPPPDRQGVEAIVARVLADDREWLTAPEAAAVLGSYGIATVESTVAENPAEAVEAAAALSGPVVLKIVSPDIPHKSDVGGVLLGLEGAERVREGAEALLRRVADARPDARIDGVSVEPQVRRPGAVELLVGASEDASFGPVVVFGRGGTATEVIRDTALGLPPLNLHLAGELMRRTRVYRRLVGYRNVPAADLEAIALTLVNVGQLIADVPEIRELDINPLLADASGALALDARIRVAPYEGSAEDRLAIRPYPAELEETLTLDDGERLLVRPVRPEDEPALLRAFGRLTPEEVRFRFLVSRKSFTHVTAARFTQIDYDRDMVLVLADERPAGIAEIHGLVQINRHPRRAGAEFALLVEKALAGRGLGTHLMRRIITYAKSRGVSQLYGDVLSDNGPMLKLCRRVGFHSAPNPHDPSLVRMTMDLREPTVS
jgi:acetyltransferase